MSTLVTHTTLVVQMDDGSHRTTNWYRIVTIDEIQIALDEYVRIARYSVKHTWATPYKVIRATVFRGLEAPLNLEVPS